MYYLPKLLQVLGPGVLVLQVVSVLPYINTKEGSEAVAPERERILTCGMRVCMK